MPSGEASRFHPASPCPSVAVPLIYNPASGDGKGEARALTARDLFVTRGIEVDLVPTTAPGHAGRLAADAARRHDKVFVLGGDGTLSEAADGILSAGLGDKVQLGFLPAGTGNDFLRDFGMEPLAVAVARIAKGRERRIDAARIRYGRPDPVDGEQATRHSINVFGTGFVADVCNYANERLKWMGKQAYTAAVFPVLMRLRPTPTKLITDGEDRSGDYTMIAVCNSVHTGGAMAIAPDAQQDDGLLDVMALGRISRVGLLRLFPKIFSGTHVQDPRVLTWRARHVHIEPNGGTDAGGGALLGDGEVYGSTPATIEVLPGALRLLL